MVSEAVAGVLRAKIAKAEEFLLVAKAAEGAHDAAVSLAVSAAINAADALSLLDNGSYPRGRDHKQAVGQLRRTRPVQARHLGEALAAKDKAQYDSRRCSAADAERTIKHAERLLEFVSDEVRRRGALK